MSRAQRFWVTLGAVAAVLAVVAALLASRPLDVTGPSPMVIGSAGLGDPYYPQAGGGGYDVQHYAVQVRAGAPGSPLQGITTITATALQDLDRIHFDLHLTARAATVNGRPTSFDQQGEDLSVQAARVDAAQPALPSGAVFTVTVEYAGDPGGVLQNDQAYYQAGTEFVIAGEPVSASLWYPANEHPSDAATMNVTVSVPAGVEAICAGRLITRGADASEKGRERWSWQVDAPTVTYASFLAVGQYRIEQGIADGRPFVHAVSQRLSPSAQDEALRWLGETPSAIRRLETYLGPYPFSGTGGFVSGVGFHWGGLETAMRPIYHNRGIGSDALLTHELAHMWLGDTVTLRQWNDLFINESLASYAQWLTAADSDPADNFRSVYSAGNRGFWSPPLSDPGREHLFERVYDRGPAAVHALRTRMGDQAFFAMLKTWAQQPGARSLEDFRRHADDATPDDLTGLFREWLDDRDRPAATTDNGVIP